MPEQCLVKGDVECEAVAAACPVVEEASKCDVAETVAGKSEANLTLDRGEASGAAKGVVEALQFGEQSGKVRYTAINVGAAGEWSG